MRRPFRSRAPAGPVIRINGKIRAREVRVIGADGSQLGVMALPEALTRARAHGVDLVEVAPAANPPVCRLVDYDKYRYEMAKKERESRKHHHARRLKEVQLRPGIGPHDLKFKLGHAIDFLCDDMKVRVSLRLRGREMLHKEYGLDLLARVIAELASYARPESEPKQVARCFTVILTPLPRDRRARKPG